MLTARWFRCSSCAQTVIHFSTLIWNSASNSAGDYSRNVCSKCAHNKQERVLKFCWKYPPQLVENNTTGFTLNMLVIMLKCLLEMCWDSCWNKSKLGLCSKYLLEMCSQQGDSVAQVVLKKSNGWWLCSKCLLERDSVAQVVLKYPTRSTNNQRQQSGSDTSPNISQ